MTKERMKRAKGQQGEVQKTVPLKEYRKKEVKKLFKGNFQILVGYGYVAHFTLQSTYVHISSLCRHCLLQTNFL